jgi:hypothetical protein
MAVMITLKLPKGARSLDAVQAMPGLKNLVRDSGFGLVRIDPSQGLFAVRTATVDDVDARKALSPEIVGTYGDVRIEATASSGVPDRANLGPCR